MAESVTEALKDWHDFYVLAGTASATLIGLMFVAASIGARYFTAEREAGLRAFLTPTVLHFSAVLVTGLLAASPRHGPLSLAVLLALEGVLGLAYTFRLQLHFRRRGFTVDLEDRSWYLFAPLLGYFLILLTGLLVPQHLDVALPVLAFAMVLLLLLGIRNAWDMTVWVVIRSE